MDMNKLEAEFTARLKERGLSLTTGKPLHVYAAHFPPHSEGCPRSAKNLQNLANGTYQRASVAYKVLMNALKPAPVGRQKSVWFSDIEETFVKHTLDHCNAIWDQFDSEVQQLAQSRASIAEAKTDELTTELHDVEKYVDELISTNAQHLATISNLSSEVELVRQHEGTITQLNERLDEKVAQLKELTIDLDKHHLLVRDMAAKTAQISRLEQHIEALESSNKSLQKSYEVELKRNGMLEGQLQLLKPPSSPEHQAAIDMVDGMNQLE
ncbi:hypothetical protein [Vibrio cyclitrophicus]|uniref:hypothetical protein n=1 Tax=Vibrio cyclitrophicus TaxID=47951 RepID=UPI00030B534F|nr:hypothetical protein [Vibrio cyclitrophicus]OEF30692.1 hypothetical protein OA9_20175 [Vibrio cyclitrophicus 1F97]OEF39545.1 hypothetical protein OAC_12350 [Vibrio cyclitrophicus 1F273]OEF79602.1 hypothetical protein OA5_02045 [Vibrio cyclitrophicus 1F111]